MFVWLKFWDIGDQGESLDVVVEEELCGDLCCMGLGIVMLNYSAIQRLMHERNSKKICFFFLTRSSAE